MLINRQPNSLFVKIKQQRAFQNLNTGEVELPNTFWLVIWDRESQKTFETMIRDVIDIFRNTILGANQKSNWDKYLSQGLSRTFDMLVMFFFRLRHFAAQC